MKKILAICLAVLLMAAAAIWAFLSGSKTAAEISGFSVWFVDVGQADCALVVCDGQTMLIDGGNVADSETVAAFLKEHNVEHLNYMIATHPHEDHIGGLSGAFEAAEVDRILESVPDEESATYMVFEEEAEQEGSQIDWVQPGETFSLGSATAEVLGPVEESDDLNDMSIVLKITYGDTSFLFMGDAGEDEEKSILEAGNDVSCTVLKVGHHGSATSSCYEFLLNAAPEYAVISVGAGNEYGHPNGNTLSRLRDVDAVVYRTDECGTICCTSDGNTVDFHDSQPSDLSGLVGGDHTDDTAVEDDTSAQSAGESESAEKPETEAESETETDAAEAEENSTGEPLPEIDYVRDIPEEYTYVLNTNTMRFHYPDCDSVQEMSDKNRAYTSATRDELLAAGYVSCGRCHP